MLLKQNKDTFIRFYNDIGYIKNQRLDIDFVYNETGMHYLKQITREPQEFDEIIERLLLLFPGISRKIIEEDFGNFVSYIESCGLISTGENEDELFSKERLCIEKKAVKSNYPIIQKDIGITHSSALLFKIFKKNPQLFDLQIEITKKCNERCIHCYLPIEERTSSFTHIMSTDEVKKVLNQAAEMGALGVTFSGGELLLRKDLIEILQFARQKDFIINLFSNVVLLTDEICSELKELNVNNVQVSLYSMDKEVHEAITRVKGSYEKTKHGIELLIKHGINVIISCPIMKINKNSFRGVQEYADSLKIKIGGDYHLIGQGNLNIENLSHRMNISEVKEYLWSMIVNNEKFKESLKSKVDNYDYRERFVEDKLACGVGVDTINIAANGDVIPCPGWYGYVLGNIAEDSLQEIWSKSKKLDDLRNVKLSQFAQCANCEAKRYCDMCILRNFNESNGDMFKVPQHTCQIAHLRKQIVEDLL